jgi:hypothetical protein
MEIKSVAQLDELETRVIAAAERAATEIRKAIGTGIDLLRRLKFEECGRHPLDDRSLAENKYVFFASPKYGAGRRSAMERNGVQVWAVEL